VTTIVALRSRPAVGVDVDCIIRAGLHTGFTTNADLGIELHDAIIPLVHRGHGADSHTGRVRTMVAARDLELSAAIWICARLNVLHPRAIYPQGYFIFRFASSRTSMAANTTLIIDNKSVIGHLISLCCIEVVEMIASNDTKTIPR
jgi:hypothetical protein